MIRTGPLVYWKFYVGACLLLWLAVVARPGNAAGALSQWPIGIVMILGSLVAGSTPMGGGTVAFPILVLLFDQPVGNARNFAFLIQAVGMTSALIFMICRKVALPWRLLAGSAAGSALGLGLGTALIAPYMPVSLVKLLFSCLWMSFAVLTLSRNREICELRGSGPPPASARAVAAGLAAGAAGGMVASMIGVGVEMAVYTVMVLVFRVDLKIAIPTAVSAAALASIEGVAVHGYLGDISPDTVYQWLAALPVVIFGAPIGAYLVSVLPRLKVLYFVSALCVFQFLWTLNQTAHGSREWWFVVAAMAVALTVLSMLSAAGARAAER